MGTARRGLQASLAAALVGLTVAGCGGGSSSSSTISTSAADIQRFCQLQVKGQKLGQRLMAPLEKENAPPAKFKAAERKIAESDVVKQLEQLMPSLPPDIADAGRTLIASQKARAGIGPAVPKQQEAAAQKQIQQFTKQNCNA